MGIKVLDSDTIERRHTNSIPGLIVFLIIILIYFTLTWITERFIYNEEFYYKSYSGIMSNQTVGELLGWRAKYWWISYLLIPISLLLKFFLTAVCINVGFMLVRFETKFKEIFRAVMLAEAVFILATIVLLMTLFLHIETLTIQSTTEYSPLSLLGLIGYENVHATWAVYPLQAINLYELFFVIAVAWLLSKWQKEDFFDSFNVVAPSYSLGLLLWIVLVAFLTLQIS